MANKSLQKKQQWGGMQILILTLLAVGLVGGITALVLAGGGSNDSKKTPASDVVTRSMGCNGTPVIMIQAAFDPQVKMALKLYKDNAPVTANAMSIGICANDMAKAISADEFGILLNRAAQEYLQVPGKIDAQKWAIDVAYKALTNGGILNGYPTSMNTGHKFEVALETSAGRWLIDQT